MWKLIFVLFIIFNIIAFFVPKRIGRIEIYATCFFAYAYGLTTDMVLDLHYHLYGYFQKGFQWIALLGIILYFPAISFLFLNFYPSEKKIVKKAIYILYWSVFSITFEWISLQTDFFYYNGWKLWYSGALYPVIFSVLVINMRLVQRIIK
ncbi:CBO0543 family protein [Bacillus salipaludis]|uniref:CBO0543 family protein n=1 Tax=Bacillus salipaludis TaxID=2547811 RepID=UPI00268A856C